MAFDPVLSALPWDQLSEPPVYKFRPTIKVALIAASGLFFSPFPIPGGGASAAPLPPVNVNVHRIHQVQYQSRSTQPPVFTPTARTVDKWLVPWSVPSVLTKRGLPTHEHQTTVIPPVFTPTARTVDKWLVPWSVPSVLTKRGLPTHEHQTTVIPPVFTPTARTVDKWLQPWSTPPGAKKGLQTNQQQTYTAPFFFTAEIITLDKWYSYWRDPAKPKVTLVTAGQQTTAYVGSDPFEVVTEDKWFQPLAEPVRQKQGLSVTNQIAPDFWSTFTPTQETVTVDKWLNPFAEPVRIKLGLIAPAQQPYATDVEPTVAFDWRQWLSEPVRALPRLQPGTQQFFATDTDPVVSFSWFNSLVDPVVKVKPWLATANQAAMGFWSTFTPEFITVDKWYVELSTPVRIPRRLQESAQQFLTADTKPIVSFDWRQWLAEPVRTQPRLQPGSNQFSAPDTNPIVSFSWFASLNDPIVKVKPWLGAANQVAMDFWSTFTPAGETITLDKWYAAWREPVRFKVSLPVTEQQYIALVKATPFEVVTQDKWYRPLSEPVRIKPPLRTAPEMAMVPFATPYITVNYGWHSPKTELPPRAKPGLLTAHQTAYTAPFITTLTPNITGILAAIEGKDSLLFSGISFNVPAEAEVGLIELGLMPLVSIAMPTITDARVAIQII
jgi:hypothetical protein